MPLHSLESAYRTLADDFLAHPEYLQRSGFSNTVRLTDGSSAKVSSYYTAFTTAALKSRDQYLNDRMPDDAYDSHLRDVHTIGLVTGNAIIDVEIAARRTSFLLMRLQDVPDEPSFILKYGVETAWDTLRADKQLAATRIAKVVHGDTNVYALTAEYKEVTGLESIMQTM